MEERAFLGKGMKFPPQINKTTGRFMMSVGNVSVKESIYIILMTQKSERWIRPDFGSRILSYTFADTSATRLNMMARELRQTILEQEPRISEVDIVIEPKLDKGCLIVNIVYTVAEDNSQDNMVFPFYLYAQAEGEINGIME